EPAAGGQGDRPLLRRFIAQVRLEPVVLRHALEPPPACPVEVTAIDGADLVRRVPAEVVPGAGDRPRLCDDVPPRRRRREPEALIDVDLGLGRVIDNDTGGATPSRGAVPTAGVGGRG